LSAENFFCGVSSGFLFVFVGLFGFLYGALGSVWVGLACFSMLFSVEFHVVKREVRMLPEVAALWEKKFQKKKASNPLYLLLPC
jgi:hypothetical protein